MKKILLATVLVLSLTGCQEKTEGPIGEGASKSAESVVDYLKCDPNVDLGCGIPDAACATSRVGKVFVTNGITYQCRGPKPYAWRRI